MINKNAENNVESHFVEVNKMGKIPDKKTPRPVGAERGAERICYNIATRTIALIS